MSPNTIAVIPSRDAPASFVKKLIPILQKYQAVFLGDGTAFEEELRGQLLHAGIPAVVFRPYFKVDSKAVFNPGMFFAANRQKIWNAEEVMVIRTKDDETQAAQEYAEKIGRRCTLLQMPA